MVNARRSELEIIGEMLTLSRDGAKTTELLYQCNLSYTQCKSYLSYLLGRNILEKKSVKNGNGYNKMYVTTEKGITLLTDINRTLLHLK